MHIYSYSETNIYTTDEYTYLNQKYEKKSLTEWSDRNLHAGHSWICGGAQARAEGGAVGAWAPAPFPLDAQSALMSRQFFCN